MCEYTAKDFKERATPLVSGLRWTIFSSRPCIRLWPKSAFRLTKQQ